MTTTTVRQVTQAEVSKNLATRQDSLEWAILAMMSQQTGDEVLMGDTRHLNGVGFNAADANKFTYMAKYMTGKQTPTLGDKVERHLSGDFLKDARERIMKYSRQITELVNAELQRRAKEREAVK